MKYVLCCCVAQNLYWSQLFQSCEGSCKPNVSDDSIKTMGKIFVHSSCRLACHNNRDPFRGVCCVSATWRSSFAAKCAEMREWMFSGLMHWSRWTDWLATFSCVCHACGFFPLGIWKRCFPQNDIYDKFLGVK